MIVNNNYVKMQSVSDTARELARATMSECDTTPCIIRGSENGNGSQDKIDSQPTYVHVAGKVTTFFTIQDCYGIVMKRDI